MDYMATGRPIVSTALPECRLYAHLFDVAETPDEFLDAVAPDRRRRLRRRPRRPIGTPGPRRTPAAASSSGSSTGCR